MMDDAWEMHNIIDLSRAGVLLMQYIWFARFWAWFGPRSRAYVAPNVIPLLSSTASGVCLDIGPGTGQWVHLFAVAENPAITKIYGVEPNVGMHAELRANAVKAGLGDVYEVVGCGAEELRRREGWHDGCIDTIVTVQCLCSIPTPEVVIRELYPLLKPGGKWLFFEHVRTKFKGEFVEGWQKTVNLIWPTFFNGCDITRPTDEWLLAAGEWDEVNLRSGAGEGRCDRSVMDVNQDDIEWNEDSSSSASPGEGLISSHPDTHAWTFTGMPAVHTL
nr:methyltransferase-like protein 7a [Quercus suber]